MNVRRSIAAAAVVLLAVPVLSSCGVNFRAQTDQVYDPAVGVNVRTGTVDVLNTLVVSGNDGSGTVVATLVNGDQENDDTLRGVSGSGRDAGLTVQTGGEITIPAGGFVNLAKDAKITARGKRVVPGNFVQLTFTFDRGQAVTVDAPVVSSDNPVYSDIPTP